jgi:Dynamin family
MTATAPAAAAPATPADNVPRIRAALDRLAGELDAPLPAVEVGGAAVATVVVVGEPKGGKSTLVNALVGRPGLSPVDYAVSTATYIAIRHGSPGARVFPDGAIIAEEVHLDELAAWTSVEGLRANPRAPSMPRPVEVTLPAPLLEQVVLVDTPGVGGVDGAHDRATLAALAGATSLLFCVDASRPLSAPELAFLDDATARIALVAFVLTKIDQSTAWRDVMAEDRALVADRVPAFAGAPWIAVAAPLAERSLDPGLPAAAARALRERSGLDAVVEHLTGAVGDHVRALEAANALKALRSAAVHLQELAEERAQILGDPSDDRRGRLLAEQSELARLASVEDEWRTGVELELTTLRATELNRLDRTLRDVQQAGTAWSKDRGMAATAFTDHVNDLLTEASLAAGRRVAAGVDGCVREIVGEAIDSPAFALALEAAARSDQVVGLRDGRDLVAEGRLQPAQTMPLVMSGTSGFMMASYTGLGSAVSAATGVASFVPGLGLAVAATGAAVLFARRQSKVNERAQWLQARVIEARSDLQAVVDQRVTTARALALRAVREWIRARKHELESSIAELNRQATRDAEQRRVATAGARARVDDLRKLIRTCDNHIERLTRR